MLDISALFEKWSDDIGSGNWDFASVKNPRHPRADLCAFIMLHEIIARCPQIKGKELFTDIIGGADHDVIYLNVSLEVVAEYASESEIIDLFRCGVCVDNDIDTLTMYV